jgi:hypothetical protein
MIGHSPASGFLAFRPEETTMRRILLIGARPAAAALTAPATASSC